jgi:UDPglucose--hexose-1-phosphate uridylyltransferase
MTPPAVLVYLKSKNGIKKDKDKNEARHRNWLVRVIPNLYPAFSPPKNVSERRQIVIDGNLAKAVGHHEVLVESPNHDEHPANARTSQLEHVVNAYVDRFRELSRKPYVKYVSVFRNHGLEAGASLSHAHSQIIATPFIPRTVKEEMTASKRFWQQDRKCAFCDIIAKERSGPRLIVENSKFVAFAPYASVNPMEFWLFPKKHEASLLEMPQDELKVLAKTLKTCLNGLKLLVNDPPYNFGFHMATEDEASDYYHWHLEVYPTLAIWAGFEKSTGTYINTITPETAAEGLRNTILS